MVSQELALYLEIFKYLMPVKYLSLLPRGLWFSSHDHDTVFCASAVDDPRLANQR